MTVMDLRALKVASSFVIVRMLMDFTTEAAVATCININAELNILLSGGPDC